MCVCVHMHMHMHVCVCGCGCVHVCVCMHMCVCECMCVCACKWVYLYNMHVYVCVCACVYKAGSKEGSLPLCFFTAYSYDMDHDHVLALVVSRPSLLTRKSFMNSLIIRLPYSHQWRIQLGAQGARAPPGTYPSLSNLSFTVSCN